MLQEVRKPEHPSQTLRLLRALELALLICRQETLHPDMLQQASMLAQAVAQFRWGALPTCVHVISVVQGLTASPALQALSRSERSCIHQGTQC